jgi:hypothetical protein
MAFCYNCAFRTLNNARILRSTISTTTLASYTFECCTMPLFYVQRSQLQSLHLIHLNAVQCPYITFNDLNYNPLHHIHLNAVQCPCFMFNDLNYNPCIIYIWMLCNALVLRSTISTTTLASYTLECCTMPLFYVQRSQLQPLHHIHLNAVQCPYFTFNSHFFRPPLPDSINWHVYRLQFLACAMQTFLCSFQLDCWPAPTKEAVVGLCILVEACFAFVFHTKLHAHKT